MEENIVVKNERKKELYDTNACLYVLSSLMHNPMLLHDDNYKLTPKDFKTNLQVLIFGAINNLTQNAVEKLTPKEIDLCIHSTAGEINDAYYRKNNGYEYLNQCYWVVEDTSNSKDQFNFYYNRVKKFSFLRELEEKGIDTNRFYNVNASPIEKDQQDEKFNKTTIKEMVAELSGVLNETEDKYVGKKNSVYSMADEGLVDLVKQYQAVPEIGLPMEGRIINYACRGARLGKLYTYSAASGMGKTRFMIENACAISMPYIDDFSNIIIRCKSNSLEDLNNPNYKKVLFIATEQQRDEIQTMILAHVSGVNEKHILEGHYEGDEFQRIEMAEEIIKHYRNFYIECIPDPSIALLKARLQKHIYQENISYIFYDYIFSSPGLLNEFRDIKVREDVALMMLSNTLKEIAAENNVFIQSATQLNETYKKELGLRDQNCIRGSKAIADKIDVGMIGVRIETEEWEKIQPIWNDMCQKSPTDFNEANKPNIVIDIYKNRRGELNNLKVFRHFDYGTLRCQDLFATTGDYKFVGDKISNYFSDKTTVTFDEFKKKVLKI